MRITASSVEEYIENCQEERQAALKKLRAVISENIPEGFEEALSYGMPGWVIPHSLYPAGYHCKPEEPLPFLSIASQKNFVGFYHMGIYAKPDLLNWFVKEYPKYVSSKLDMGKSCIRFKKVDEIPYDLIAELIKKVSPQDWINTYESYIKR